MRKSRRRFSEEFKRSVLDEIKRGKSIYKLSKIYNIQDGVIYKWKRKYMDNIVDKPVKEETDGKYRKYSEDFKKKLVEELKSGISAHQLSRKYDVATSLIRKWRDRYSDDKYKEIIDKLYNRLYEITKEKEFLERILSEQEQ